MQISLLFCQQNKKYNNKTEELNENDVSIHCSDFNSYSVPYTASVLVGCSRNSQLYINCILYASSAECRYIYIYLYIYMYIVLLVMVMQCVVKVNIWWSYNSNMYVKHNWHTNRRALCTIIIHKSVRIIDWSWV